MNHRLLLLGLLLLGIPLFLVGQGITVNDPSKNWMINIPEPPIPRVAAGQSFISVYGHKVTRLTDNRTDRDGGSWMHYYSDRSPLSRNSSYITYFGPSGSTWIQPMNNGTPRGPAWPVFDVRERPITIGMSQWSPIDDETLFFVGDRTELWSINARTRKKKMIRSFEKEIAKNPITKEGYLRPQFVSKDGKRILMDYERQSKQSYGFVLYDMSTNTVNMFHGDRILNSKKIPPPINSTFRLAGVAADKDGEFVLAQENGAPINTSSPIPQEAVGTQTSTVKWGEDPFQGPGKARSLAGHYSTDHGAALSKGHIRIAGTEVGYYINNVDWLFAMRRIDLTQPYNPSDKKGFPFRDVFYWPYSTGGGAHVSSGGISDDWIALSTYQEAPCGQRINTPMSNEIVMLSTTAEAVYDEKNHRLVKNGELHRLTHHFSYPEDCQKPVSYWGQPHAAISMDGKYAVFTSTFGRTGRTDVFVITLPKHLTPASKP